MWKQHEAQYTDEEIIELYWRREERAIWETDKKYGQFLFRLAFNILHDPLDCEECKNDTYLGLWDAIPPTRPTVFPAFIVQILRRIAINRYKEKICKKRIPSQLTESVEDFAGTLTTYETPESRYAVRELGKTISDYVRGLSDRQRYLFIERFYMAESVENIAKDLGIAVSTAYREMEKIKRGLKDYLEKREVYI